MVKEYVGHENDIATLGNYSLGLLEDWPADVRAEDRKSKEWDCRETFIGDGVAQEAWKAAHVPEILKAFQRRPDLAGFLEGMGDDAALVGLHKVFLFTPDTRSTCILVELGSRMSPRDDPTTSNHLD